MGDVLPHKRETVERLNRRFEIYRAIHSDRLPRYEQNANDNLEAERQGTLLLRQRFLESKAKKAKNKSDHHRSYKDSISDSNKTPMAKSVKRAAEEPLQQLQTSSNEDCEKSSKMARTESLPDKKPDLVLTQQNCLKSSLQNQQQQSSQQTPTLSTYSVQIVSNFTNQQSAINSNGQKPLNSPQVSLPSNNQTDNKPVLNKDENSQSSRNSCSTSLIECKQEKDNDPSDMCQYKTVTPNGNSCDSLSDTFPSIGVSEDSGENLLPPEVLQDLIKDMAENTDYSDLMKGFFDGGGSHLKDQDIVGKEIAETPNAFQSDEVPLVPIPPNEQLNGMFPLPTSSLYNQPAQRLPPSYMNTNMDGTTWFYYKKPSEPTVSLAARTLKQLAEQHHLSLQQKQQVFNPSTFVNRPSFNKDNHFTNQPQNTQNFLNGTNPVNQTSEGTTNSSSYALDHLPEELFGTTPTNCEQPSPSNRFDINKPRIQETSSQQQQVEEPPPYGNSRLLNHYSENAQVRPLNSLSNNQYVPLSPIGNRLLQNNSDLRFQFPQQQQQPQQQPQQTARQIHMGHINSQPQPNEFKQLDKMQQYSSVFNSYSQQQQQQQQTNPNQAFQVSMSQSLPVSQSLTYTTTQFSPTVTKPPPEYKSHHSLISGSMPRVEQPNNLLQPMYNHTNNKNTKFGKVQRPPNVTISSDGTAIPSASHNWRPPMRSMSQSLPVPIQNRFRANLNTFPNNYNLQSTGPPLSPLYNQYRASGIQMPVTGNQMPVTGNQMPVTGTQISSRPTGPRSQITLPRNQIPMPRNQIPMPGNQLSNNRLIRPDNTAMVMQQRQRMNIAQCQRSPTMAYLDQHSSMGVQSNSMSSPNRTLSPMSPMGSFVGSKEMMRNDGTISPLCQMGQYSGPKDGMLSPASPMGSYGVPNKQTNSGHINLDIFDNVPDLFDFSDIV